MTSKKIDTGSKDLISGLPDALICYILSFLSTKDVALTSILSKRWRNMLAFVPNLDFDNIYYLPDEMRRKKKIIRLKWKRFRLFVDKVMALQGDAPLNKFSLQCVVGRNPTRVNGWIHRALERGLVELDLYSDNEDYNNPLPLEVLMSNTLVRLKVAGAYEFTIDVREVFLPKLKTLHIEDVVFNDKSGAAFAKLVSGCHALEELVVINVTESYWESCSVSNPSLKRVTIHQAGDPNPKNVSFYTPDLVYLELYDTVAFKYPTTNFDSLVQARLCLSLTIDQCYEAKNAVKAGDCYSLDVATDFFMAISNVKILYLSDSTLEVLDFYCKAIPVFNNLIRLTIGSHQDVRWEPLQTLLENCPNLETLVFEGLHYRDTNQCWDESYRFRETNKCYEGKCVCKPWKGTPICLSSSPVKILKVLKFGEFSSYYGDDMDKQMDMIKHFVETMPNLEQVIINCNTQVDRDVSTLSTAFQRLDKVASHKCIIQVISDNISFSSTVYSSPATNVL